MAVNTMAAPGPAQSTNGLRVDHVYNEDKSYLTFNGKPVDTEPTCEAIDEDGCRF